MNLYCTTWAPLVIKYWEIWVMLLSVCVWGFGRAKLGLWPSGERERIIRVGAVARISWAERIRTGGFSLSLLGKDWGENLLCHFSKCSSTLWHFLEDSHYSSFSEILSIEEDDLEVLLVVVVERENESLTKCLPKRWTVVFCGRLLSFRPRVGVRHESPTANLAFLGREAR